MKTHSIILLFGVVAMVSLPNARTTEMKAESLNGNEENSTEEDYLLLTDRDKQAEDEQAEDELTEQSQTEFWPYSVEQAGDELDDARFGRRSPFYRKKSKRSRCFKCCRRRYRFFSDEQAGDKQPGDKQDDSVCTERDQHTKRIRIQRRICYNSCKEQFPKREE